MATKEPEDISPSKEPRQIRKLTEKAMEHYKTRIDDFSRKLLKVRTSIEETITHSVQYSNNVTVLKEVKILSEEKKEQC